MRFNTCAAVYHVVDVHCTLLHITSDALACRLLVLFCIISFVIYVDRGVIACNGVQGDVVRPGMKVSLLCFAPAVPLLH